MLKRGNVQRELKELICQRSMELGSESSGSWTDSAEEFRVCRRLPSPSSWPLIGMKSQRFLAADKISNAPGMQS
jgi:hypothetical protein